MTHPSQFRTTSCDHRPGFALIVTLLLMILLTVIAVGLLSLSTITLRTSSHDEDIQTARANARMALMLAIGDLQKQLGPDTRISATADQITGSDPQVSTTPRAQKQWTGAYQSWAANMTNRPAEPVFLQWLVSGNPNTVKIKSSAESAVSGNSVEIVSANSVGSADPVRVSMLEQSVSGSKNRFAWWVGDEGVKAYVPSGSLPTPNGTSDARLALQAAPHFGLEVMKTDVATPFETFNHESPDHCKFISFKQAGLAASSPAESKPLFHDITTLNRGLLTNVRAGGFRKDLSMTLQAPATAVPKTALYTAGGRAGINLAELWSYYNLWNELKTGTGNYTTGNAIPNGTSYLQQATTLATLNSDKYHHYKQPAFIRFQQLLSFYAKEILPATTPKTYALGIVVDPIITVWNPLDVPLSLQGSFMSIKYFALPYDLNITFDGVSQSYSLGKILGNQAGFNFVTMRLGNGTPALILKPGEVMTFSQQNSTPVMHPGNLGATVEAKPGWVYNPTAGGFYYHYGEKFTNTPFFKGPGSSSFNYALKPNADKSLGGNYASAHNIYYKYGAPADGESKSVGYYTINTQVTASDPKHLDFFNQIPPSEMLQLGNFVTKRPFMVFSFSAKTEESARNPGRFLARYNPRAIRMDFFDLKPNEQRMMPFEIKVDPVTSVIGLDQVVGQAQANGTSYFGGGWTPEYGSGRVIAYTIPRQPTLSLAAFQHSMANGFTPDNSGRINNNNLNYLLPMISHAIGNSLASPLLTPEAIEGSIGAGPIADHSYLANQALWDDYFLSGISPQTAAVFANKRDQTAVAKDFLAGTKLLPVKHYKPNLQGLDPAATLAKIITGSTPTSAAPGLTASLISVDGMFNVNSTSVEAWKAILSSLRKRSVTGQSGLGADATIDPSGDTPIASLQAPSNIKVTSNTGDLDAETPEAQWSGIHMISDAEIEALARAVVSEVRKRGPFLSLADFVNRRVGTDKSLALSGAIQSALDSTSVTINQPFRTGDRASSGSEDGLAFPEAERGAAAYGIPGYVKQADILTPIAPILSARSDTFLIRGYGEKTNADGTLVLAKACCEAVVQRGPNFVNPAEEITAIPAPGSINHLFGRRFEIVSFRWLNPAEM